MQIWLLTIGETIPRDSTSEDRLFRTGLFARSLAANGHQVLWWTSAFDHFRKAFIAPEDDCFALAKNLKVQFLKGCGYGRNISLARLRDHAQIARKFKLMAASQKLPDVIVAAYPSIELALEAVRFGKAHNIPVVVDIRDLWPDIFVSVAPKILRPFARLMLDSLFRNAKEVLSDASALWAVSESYLKWGLKYADRTEHAYDLVAPLGFCETIVGPDELLQARSKLLAQGVDPQKNIAWFIGMFGRSYDLSTVIKAARIFDNQGVNNLQFVLSGTGDSLKSIMRQAAGLKNVVFTGWIDRNQASLLMSWSRIGLMAYAQGASQSLPNKLFEFLAAGRPICSSLKGESQLLLSEEQCGVTYTAGDSSALVAAISALLEDAERLQKMALRAQQLFKAKFDANRICKTMQDQLELILDAGRSRARAGMA